MIRKRQSLWRSYGLFHQLAIVLANKARRFAAESRDLQRDERVRNQAMFRQMACTAGAIACVQAALETWINSALVDAGIPQKGGWIERWKKGLPELAKILGRPEVTLPKDLERFMQQLTDLRKRLLHGDERAIRDYTETLGMGIGDLPADAYLHSGNCEWALDRAEQLFRLVRGSLGLAAPSAEWRTLLDEW